MKFDAKTWERKPGRRWRSSGSDSWAVAVNQIFIETTNTEIDNTHLRRLSTNGPFHSFIEDEKFKKSDDWFCPFDTLETIEEQEQIYGKFRDPKASFVDATESQDVRYIKSMEMVALPNTRLEIASRIAVPLFNKFAAEHFLIHSEAGVASAALKLADELISQEKTTRK